MLSQSLRTTLVALMVTLTAGLMGCDDACTALGREICACKPTDRERQTCNSQVDDRAANTDVSAKEQERCEKLLDTCTCDALDAGDLAACGLAE